MKKTLNAKASVSIKAAPAKVWKALTTPALIKKYLMDTNVTTDGKKEAPLNMKENTRGKGTVIKELLKKLSRKKYCKALI